MKIMAGIDELERSEGLISLLEALKFKASELELLKVIERITEIGVPHIHQDLIARFLKMQEEEAEDLLKSVRKSMSSNSDYKVSLKLLTGASANKLIQHAAEAKADLLALGSSGKGLLQRAIVGSVGKKALISAPCSVLISRGAKPLTQPITAVLATDHSEYAERWLDRFISWQPQGIGKLIVTTVQPPGVFVSTKGSVAKIEQEFGSWMKGELQRRNEQTINRLSQVSKQLSSRVESGERVDDTLERVIREEKADLLIMGAQGHGFIDRALIGSISLEMALSRQLSVLVVRNP